LGSSEANRSAYSQEAKAAGRHGENVRPMSGTSTRVHEEWQGSAGASPLLFGAPPKSLSTECPAMRVTQRARCRAPRVPLELCCEGGTLLFARYASHHLD
jgi:hypothetical protein